MEKPKFQRVTKKRSKAALRGTELAVVEMSIKSILLHEALMIALFNNMSVFHDEDHICFTDG